ncbi:type VII toxin-antitoxin system HepT family RNase toxin [Candidatus Bipolaricaulota sp. J31]
MAKLEEYVSLLEELRRLSREEFLATPRNYLYAAHLLQVAIQCVIDIGAHIVSGLNLGKVDRYGDIPALLAKNGVISTELASRVEKMFGLRNILVHEYLEVDYGALYRFILENLVDFQRFAADVTRFLERKRGEDGRT